MNILKITTIKTMSSGLPNGADLNSVFAAALAAAALSQPQQGPQMLPTLQPMWPYSANLPGPTGLQVHPPQPPPPQPQNNYMQQLQTQQALMQQLLMGYEQQRMLQIAGQIPNPHLLNFQTNLLASSLSNSATPNFNFSPNNRTPTTNMTPTTTPSTNSSPIAAETSLPTISQQDSLVDQHFRRSLGEDYNQMMASRNNKR